MVEPRIWRLEEIERMPQGQNGGYIIRYLPNGHRRYRSAAYAFEHRLIAEAILGRQLGTDEVVHHRNRNKSDNRPDNLEILGRRNHAKEHAPLLGSFIKCPVCRNDFYMSRANQRRGRRTCSNVCGRKLPGAIAAKRHLKPRQANVELNKKVAALKDAGATWREVAQDFGVCIGTVRDRYRVAKKGGG